LRAALSAAGVPDLVLEMEGREASEAGGALRTRLQAFLEMLR